MKKTKIILLLILVVSAVIVLVFRPELLSYRLSERQNIPLGTFVSWIGIFAYAAFWYVVLPAKNNDLILRIVERAKRINLFLAVLWGIFSFWVSGNWAFTFKNSSQNFKTWIGFTALIALLPLLLLLFLGIRRIFKYQK